MLMEKDCLNCPIGKAKSEELLASCDSVFDAVFDFQDWVKTCECSKNIKDGEKEKCSEA